MLNAIQAFMRHDSQGGPSQPKGHYDPMNIAASYLAATTATVPYSVEIVVVKRGRGFTNLEASIVQKVSCPLNPSCPGSSKDSLFPVLILCLLSQTPLSFFFHSLQKPTLLKLEFQLIS